MLSFLKNFAESRPSEEEIERAKSAERILHDPVFRDAMDMSIRTFYEQWLSADSVEARESAWARTHAIQELEQSLRSIIAHGEYAELAAKR